MLKLFLKNTCPFGCLSASLEPSGGKPSESLAQLLLLRGKEDKEAVPWELCVPTLPWTALEGAVSHIFPNWFIVYAAHKSEGNSCFTAESGFLVCIVLAHLVVGRCLAGLPAVWCPTVCRPQGRAQCRAPPCSVCLCSGFWKCLGAWRSGSNLFLWRSGWDSSGSKDTV